MSDLLSFLISSEFMPHGHCYFWRPEILWLHAGSDALIAFSYYLIPLAILSILRARRDLVFHWMFALFALFIFLCGTTHLVAIWTIWNPSYRLEGIVKFLTAVVSVSTAFALWRIRPLIFSLPSPDLLRDEIQSRKRAQQELELARSELAERVRERTTELQRANSSLKRLATVMEASSDAILATLPDGTIATLNQSAQRFLGTSFESSLGQKVWDLHSPLSPRVWMELSDRAVRGETIIDLELSTDLAGGSPRRYLSVSVSPVRSGDGKIDSVSFIIRDATERHRHERLFRMAVQAAPQAMLVVNEKGRVVLSNNKAEELFGYTAEELARVSIDELVPGEFSHVNLRFPRESALSSSASPMGRGRELYAVRSDGIRVAVEVGFTPVETSQGTLVISALTDITERKRAREQLEASLREKEILLKEVHHRVKNNLQVVSSLLKLQASFIRDTQARGMFIESEERVRAIALVHERLYRSESLSRIDFKSYLEELATSLVSAHRWGTAEIELHIDITPIDLSIDKAIPCGLIMNELIINALKHAFHHVQKGSLYIKLIEERGMVAITIADNGTGLPEDLQVSSPETLGLKLVGTLCAQIGATLKTDKIAEGPGGAEFTLSFKSALDD